MIGPRGHDLRTNPGRLESLSHRSADRALALWEQLGESSLPEVVLLDHYLEGHA